MATPEGLHDEAIVTDLHCHPANHLIETPVRFYGSSGCSRHPQGFDSIGGVVALYRLPSVPRE